MGQLFTTHGILRWIGFLAGWIVLGRVQPSDLLAGVLVAGLAARLSLHLLPPGRTRLSLPGVLAYAGRFATGSLAAGWDVARRVVRSPPDVAPGIATVPCPVPEGTARDAFRALASLQPGTLPLAGPGPGLKVHGLDMRRPVAAELEADAQAFLAMAGGRRLG